MNTFVLVVAGIVAYWLAVVVLRNRGLLPDAVKTQGPILTIHTRRGRAFLNWLAGPKRFWRAWANFGVGVALVVMALAFVFLVLAALDQMRTAQPSVVTQPRNVVIIPGVNEFLPLAVAPEILAGLLVGLVVHEGGHGLLCRVEDIDIESMGLVLFALIPIGAFVEPNDESRRRTDRGGQTRMFAAGVTNNFAVTVIAFGLLFGPVAGSIAVADGVHVGTALPGSAAEEAGIDRGDRITAVGGQRVDSAEELDALLANTSARTVAVELNGEETVQVTRSLLVTGVLRNGPYHLQEGDTIAAVNGTEVSTTRELYARLENRTVVTVRTADGDASTFPAGVYATVLPGEPLADAGAPAGGAVVITRIGDERVLAADDLDRVMRTTDPRETIEVVAYVDGEREVYTVTLAEHPSGDYGFLGVRASPGITGITVSDFGTRTYPADVYLSLLGGGGSGGSVVQRTLFVLALPIVGATGTGLPFNFFGFTGAVANFYRPAGPLGFLGGWVFALANFLFWIGWVNFNLAFFNCIPGYPLDGGHILRNAAEAVISRLPVERGRRATRMVTTAVGVTMLLSLVLLLFGQGLLAG